MTNEELILVINELSSAFAALDAKYKQLEQRNLELHLANEILKDQNSHHIKTHRAMRPLINVTV